MKNYFTKTNIGVSCLMLFSAACSPEKEQTQPNT